MDFTFETISASEHDRLQTLYTPLTQAVRRLMQAGIRTSADEETIREAQTAIEAVVEKLEGTVEDEVAQVRLAVDGRPVVWGNPVDRVSQRCRPAVGHARGAGRPVVE